MFHHDCAEKKIGTVMTKKIPFYIICISFLQLVSMAWHTFVFDHNHPVEFFGEGVQAILHGEDKKWLFLALVIFFFVALRILRVHSSPQTMRYRRYVGVREDLGIGIYADPMKRAMRRGIMHGKLCG